MSSTQEAMRERERISTTNVLGKLEFNPSDFACRDNSQPATTRSIIGIAPEKLSTPRYSLVLAAEARVKRHSDNVTCSPATAHSRIE